MIDQNSIIKACEDGIKAFADIRIDTELKRIVICGTGKNILPAYIVKGFLGRTNIPIIINEGYALPEIINRHTLVLMLSKEGDDEEVLSNYRVSLRQEGIYVAVNSSGKLHKLTDKSKDIQTINYPDDSDEHMDFGFILFGILSFLNENEFCSDVSQEMHKTLELVSKKDFSQMGMMLSKRIMARIPLLITTSRLVGMARIMKVLFNSILKRKFFYSALPMATYSDFHTYEDKNDDFYSIILRDEQDPRALKANIDTLKQQIKRNGQDVIEINMTGEYYLQRLMSIYLMTIYAIEHLKTNDQQQLDYYE